MWAGSGVPEDWPAALCSARPMGAGTGAAAESGVGGRLRLPAEVPSGGDPEGDAANEFAGVPPCARGDDEAASSAPGFESSARLAEKPMEKSVCIPDSPMLGAGRCIRDSRMAKRSAERSRLYDIITHF